MSKIEVVKREGIVNEEGKVIVPFEYEYVRVLNSGVYVAVKGERNFEESKPVCNKYYHHKKLIPIKDESRIHLYTDKGKIAFNQPILDYVCNNNGTDEIVALKIPEGWRLVELDYEKNILNAYYSTVDRIVDMCDGYIAVERVGNGCTVYSMDNWEKVFELTEAAEIIIISESGFLVTEKETRKYAFYNLSGCMILDYEWDCICCEDDYIVVIQYLGDTQLAKKKVIYSYDGEELEVNEYEY